MRASCGVRQGEKSDGAVGIGWFSPASSFSSIWDHYTPTPMMKVSKYSRTVLGLMPCQRSPDHKLILGRGWFVFNFRKGISATVFWWLHISPTGWEWAPSVSEGCTNENWSSSSVCPCMGIAYILYCVPHAFSLRRLMSDVPLCPLKCTSWLTVRGLG